MNPEQMYQQLAARMGGVGDPNVVTQQGVGDTSVIPYYVGQGAPGVGAQVQPYYPGVGAPAQAVPQIQERPVGYSPTVYHVGDVSYMGFGQTAIAAGDEVDISIKPVRPFQPQSQYFPSTVQGLLIKNASIGGTQMFATNDGIPIELFSEVSTVPQLLWPTLTPSVGIIYTVVNPTTASLNFEGMLYGTQVRN